MSLRDDLDSFREQKTISEFGQACFNDYGPGDVMTDEVLQNIVDFAHHQKLATKEDLTRETKWSGVSIYGDDILRLIAKHHPLPPSVAPLQPHLGPGAVNNASPSTGPSEVAPVKTKRVNSCKACGTPGHICAFIYAFIDMFPILIIRCGPRGDIMQRPTGCVRSTPTTCRVRRDPRPALPKHHRRTRVHITTRTSSLPHAPTLPLRNPRTAQMNRPENRSTQFRCKQYRQLAFIHQAASCLPSAVKGLQGKVRSNIV